MELLIIRHAQSTNNTLVDPGERVVDPPLTGLGLQQAELVAKHLANGHDHETPPIGGLPVDSATNGMRIERLYCSAMLRALQTATAIGHVLELQPQVWVDVHEEGGMWLDHGDGEGIQGYPGLTRSEIAAQFPQVILPAEVTAGGWWRHGREEWTSFQERAKRVADALRKDGRDPGCIAIVTHGGFSTYLLRALVGVPAAAPVFFHHDNTGITRVRLRADGSVSIRYQNRMEHLPPEMIT